MGRITLEDFTNWAFPGQAAVLQVPAMTGAPHKEQVASFCRLSPHGPR